MPNFAHVPEWVRWIARDDDGRWYCYEDEPEPNSRIPGWEPVSGKMEQLELIELVVDWREAKQPWPAAAAGEDGGVNAPKGVLDGTIKLDSPELALLLDHFQAQRPIEIPVYPGRPIIFKSVAFIDLDLDDSQTELIYTIRFTAVFESDEQAAAGATNE